MKSTSFSIALGRNRASLHDGGKVYEDERCSLWINSENDHHLRYQVTEAGFHVFVGERLRDQEWRSAGPELPGQGTLLQFDAATGTLTLTTDRLGTAMVYQRPQGTDAIYLSNRLEHLSWPELTTHWNAVQQYLCRGYTLASDTFFKEIHQNLPNQLIHICAGESQVSVKQSERPSTPPTGLTRDEIIERISLRLSERLTNQPPGILMMSAGWDSRTLLLTGAEPFVTAYSHGDLSSREIRIAQQLTGQSLLDHSFTEISRLDFPPELLETMMEQTGFCVFPIWYHAAQRMARLYDAPLVSGVLGELLGGHYGLLSFGGRWQKLKSALFVFNHQNLSNTQVEGMVRRFALPPSSHWFLTEEANNHFAEMAPETGEQTFNLLLKNFRAKGDWQLAIEQFNMEHRARQYILKQPQAGLGHLGYRLPLGDEEVVRLANGIPFEERVHNKLNQSILRGSRPALLNAPMSATLVAAKYPVPLQELSRGLRIALEILARKMGRGSPHLGWFNYEHLYAGRCLHQITDSLSLDLWDKPKMHRILETNSANGIDAGSTLDMLCKIRTVDYYLGQGR